jgi:hypothetical protein
MRDFFEQVARAGQSDGLYFLALAGSLMIPDLCAAMESDDGLATPQRYISWADRYLAPKYGGNLSGENCYGLRCALLHQGRLRPHSGSWERVLFIEPGPRGGTVHNNSLGDALNIDVQIFVADMVDAALAWLSDTEDSANYRANLGKFMQRYPDGIPGYIEGPPIIS